MEIENLGGDTMEAKKMLILSNMAGSGFNEDVVLKEAFEADGHCVDIKSVDYNEADDSNYEIVMRRNTWVSKEEDTAYLHQHNLKLIERLTAKNMKTVNLIGLDGLGKSYLVDLFKANERVIPTIKSQADLTLLPDCEKYVVKDIKSFGNGLYQKIVAKEDLERVYSEGDIIQAFMNFKAEIQVYYVGKKLMYTFEYTPSKYPHYPEPRLIELTEEEQMLAKHFVDVANFKHGFVRIDFLRLQDDSLILMEIEDHAPFMNLLRLPLELREAVVAEYKQNIYDYLAE